MGAQHVGMCKDLAAEYKYIDTFLKEADDYLAPFMAAAGLPMSGPGTILDVMYNSDKKTLAQVVNGCNSTLLHSMCIWKILQTEYDILSVFNHEHNVIDVSIMGHSIGEMGAMYGAGL